MTFTWDISAGLPVVLGDGNQCVYGAGLESMVTANGTYYYLADGLGSTLAMADTSGAVQKSYTYDVYGKPTATGALANEFDFAGEQTDSTGRCHSIGAPVFGTYQTNSVALGALARSCGSASVWVFMFGQVWASYEWRYGD